MNVDGINIYTKAHITDANDQVGRIYIGQEELKVRRIGHNAMLEQDAVHIGCEADLAAHVLDVQGRQLSVKGLLDTGAVVSVMPVKTWTDMGFERSDLIPTNIRLAAANQGAIYVAGRTPIISLQLGGRHLWMSFLVVEILDESDQFILGRDFVRNFDVTIDLNDGLIRIKDPERKYEKRPLNKILINQAKVPIFLDRKVRLKPNQAVVATFRMRNLNELSNDRQVCLVPNPNSKSSAILERSFSLTQSGLCVSVLLNTEATTVTIQRGKKLGYALPLNTDFLSVENLKKFDVTKCPLHANQECIMKRVNELKSSRKLFSMKSETDDGLSSCSNFPERPTEAELAANKPVLPEIEHLKGKISDKELDSLRAVLNRNADVFSKHKADIGCCIFVEHEIEIEEGSVPHREGPEAVEAVLTWKAPKTVTQLMSFLGFANYYREFIKGYADKIYPMQRLMRNKGKKFTWTDEAQVSFENIKRELCEAPVLGMPTEKGMFVLDTDASVVAISGILHQEQEWNGRTVLRPIAYGSKVLSDTELKYGAPKAEMFAEITFVEKYRAYLGSAPFKLRVDNRALAWLKTYSIDQSYIGRWIVRLDGYHMIIEHRTRDKHQNADSLSKKTEFYERLEEKQANQSEIKDGFSFLDKETYDELPLTRWLDKSGHPIPGHPDLPVETAAEIKFLARGEPVPLDLLVRSNLVHQELTRLGINSMALLKKTVNVAPDVMRKLRDLLDREVDRHDREWMETMQRLTVTERTEKRPVSIRSRGVERDCRSIVNQLVTSMPKEVLLRTSFTEYGTLNQNQATEEVRIRSKSSFTRRVHFTDAKEEYEPSPDCSSVDETMSGESDTFEPVKDDSSEESDTFEPVQDDLSGERLTRPPRGKILSGESGLKRQMDRVLSGESRNISDNLEYDVEESVDSRVDSKHQSWDNTSETASNSDMSEIAIHSLLVDWKKRGLDRETHQDPDRDRYTSDEEGTVVDNAADELELIAVLKRPTRLLPHGTVVRTNLEPSVQEATPLKKIWCVKLMDDAHAPEIMSGQMNVVKTYLKARYRLSDLLRAQRNDRMTSSLKRWIENGAPDKGDLEEDSYKILKQFYLKRNDLLYLNKDGIVACKRKEEDKVLYKYNSIVLPQLYQTELLFRSHDQMGHQGVDKVYNRIQKRFEWPGLKKACEKWIAACL